MFLDVQEILICKNNNKKKFCIYFSIIQIIQYMYMQAVVFFHAYVTSASCFLVPHLIIPSHNASLWIRWLLLKKQSTPRVAEILSQQLLGREIMIVAYIYGTGLISIHAWLFQYMRNQFIDPLLTNETAGNILVWSVLRR